MAINFSFDCERWPGLAKIVEECGELIAAAGKLMVGHGQSDPFGNRKAALRNTTVEDLEEEMADVIASIDFLVKHNPELDGQRILRRVAEKYGRYEAWRKNQFIYLDSKP